MNRAKPIFAFLTLLLIQVFISCADREEIDFFPDAGSSGSSSFLETSSSSIASGDKQSSSSVAASYSSGESPSSSGKVASSSSAHSSSSAGPLSCTGLAVSAYATYPITMPDLICSNGAKATSITWLGTSINWDNPEAEEYNISVRATCGTVANLTASCGSLTVSPLPTLSCKMQAKGYAGKAVQEPELSCSSGTLTNPSWTGAPVWSNPAKGAYTVGVTADCSTATGLTADCSSLDVIEPELNCNMESSGIAGAITQPKPTCGDGSTPSDIAFITAPALNWDTPQAAKYSVEVNADCGAGILEGNCGDLTVEPAKLTCEVKVNSGHPGSPIATPALTCNNGKDATGINWVSGTAPVWNKPAVGEYGDIKVIANCGTITSLNADCDGTLTIDSSGTFIDTRNNKTYKWVGIVNQAWMAENLNYEVDGSLCYNNNTVNCETYGRLYTWQMAMDDSASSSANPSGVKGVCPSGWHLPSRNEWQTLSGNVGNGAGTKLRTVDGWSGSTSCVSGTDDYGFSLKPGGMYYKNFSELNMYGYLWTSTQYSNISAYPALFICTGTLSDNNERSKSYFYSVRCVKD